MDDACKQCLGGVFGGVKAYSWGGVMFSRLLFSTIWLKHWLHISDLVSVNSRTHFFSLHILQTLKVFLNSFMPKYIVRWRATKYDIPIIRMVVSISKSAS